MNIDTLLSHDRDAPLPPRRRRIPVQMRPPRVSGSRLRAPASSPLEQTLLPQHVQNSVQPEETFLPFDQVQLQSADSDSLDRTRRRPDANPADIICEVTPRMGAADSVDSDMVEPPHGGNPCGYPVQEFGGAPSAAAAEHNAGLQPALSLEQPLEGYSVFVALQSGSASASGERHAAYSRSDIALAVDLMETLPQAAGGNAQSEAFSQGAFSQIAAPASEALNPAEEHSDPEGTGAIVMMSGDAAVVDRDDPFGGAPVATGDEELRPCRHCGRSFAEAALARHELVCQRVFCRQRRQYNAAVHRQAEGAAAARPRRGK